MRLYLGVPKSQVIPGQYGYALAHEVIQDPEFLLSLSLTNNVILDNGADEMGEGMGGHELAYLLGKVSPEYLILPDVLGNGMETWSRGVAFLTNLRRVVDCGVKFIGVAQGQDWGEFYETYNHWLTNPAVHTIGIPYDIDFDVPGCSFDEEDEELFTNGMKRASRRIQVMRNLLLDEEVGKPFHLLGSNDLWEMTLLYKDYPELLPHIESHDTTSPYAAAQAGVRFEHISEDVYLFGQEKNWSTLDFRQTTWDYDLLKWNIECYLEVCQVPKTEHWRYLPYERDKFRLLRGPVDLGLDE